MELWSLVSGPCRRRRAWAVGRCRNGKWITLKNQTVKTELRNCGRFATARTGHRAPRHRTCKRCGTVAGRRIYSREALPVACESHTACHAVGFTVLAAHGTFTFHRMVSGRPEATRAAACSSGLEPRRAVASRVSRLSVSERCSASSCCACQKERNHNRHTIHLAFAATLRPRSPLLGPLSFQPPPCPPLHVYIIRA